MYTARSLFAELTTKLVWPLSGRQNLQPNPWRCPVHENVWGHGCEELAFTACPVAVTRRLQASDKAGALPELTMGPRASDFSSLYLGPFLCTMGTEAPSIGCWKGLWVHGRLPGSREFWIESSRVDSCNSPQETEGRQSCAPLTLRHTHSHTLRHTHSHMLRHTHSHTPRHTHSHTPRHPPLTHNTQTHSLTYTQTHSLTYTQTHTHLHTLRHTHSHVPAHTTHELSPSPHSHTQVYTHSHTLILIYM